MATRKKAPTVKKLTRGQRVIAFIEKYCIVPEGSLVGKNMVLDKFQKKFILDVYDNPHGTREGYLSIARKNGKTGLIAGLLLAHIAGPEAVLNSQIISGAMSRDQAAIVFKQAYKMVMLSPDLSRLVTAIPSLKTLVGVSKNVEYKALANEGKTAHGLSPIFALLDEVGQIRGPQSDFVDAITTAQGAHSKPLLIAISTQAPNDGDLFSIWLDDARDSKDPHIVSHVYSALADCDVMDKKAWKASNPALGSFRSLTDLEENAKKAARMPSFEATFRNLMLNQRVEMSTPFIPRSVWIANGGEAVHDVFYSNPVYCGLDLSGKNDLTALVMACEVDGHWHIKSMFWTPRTGIKDRSKRDRAPYDIWENQGYIRAVSGVSIDYSHVAQDILDALEGMQIEAIAFDRWRIDIFKKEVDRLGVVLPLVEFGQGFRDMAPALSTLETALLNGNVSHGMHPVLSMCAANAITESDAADNRKLTKKKSTGRIDGMVALAMAIGVAHKTTETNNEPSIYETPGFSLCG